MTTYTQGMCLTKPEDLRVPIPRSYLIYGLPGAGKTTTAASVSEYFPTQNPWKARLKEPCILKDMMWLEADKDGLYSLLALNIKPAVTFSLYEVLRQPREGEQKVTAKDIDEALSWFYKEMEYARNNLGIEWVVIDTLTTITNELERDYVHGSKCPVSMKGEKNIQGGWSAMGNQITVMRRNLMMSDLKYMYLVHPKINNAEMEAGKEQSWQRRDKNASTAEVKARAKVTGTASYYNDIVPAIPGKNLAFINGEVSLELWIEAIDRPGKPTQYVVYPDGHDGAQGKNRYKEILSKMEPADLRALEGKIRNFVTGEVVKDV